MNDIIGGVISGGLLVYFIYNIRENTENERLSDENRRLKNDLSFSKFNRDRWHDQAESLLKINQKLKADVKELTAKADRYKKAYKEAIEECRHDSTLDADIEEAIRYAMKNSHPDKPNGSAAEFRKFHSLYKKHCK